LINPPTSSTSTPQPPWTPIVVLKGALVAIDRTSGVSTIVPFQYNPIELTRAVSPVFYQGRGDRYNGTAKQTLTLKVTLDASDDGGPAGFGVLPQLASLELMVNPSSSSLSSYRSTSQSAKIEVLPPLAPRILFVWGPSRVLPVRITKIDFSETQFNTNLNPIYATASLSLEVYPYSDAGDPEYGYLLSNLQILESTSLLNVTTGQEIGVDALGLI
jgi:hypothetical protein